MNDWWFVYGTLRPGQGNHRWVRPAVLEEILDCTTTGVMHAHSYPWVDFDQEGTVLGALLLMDTDDRITQDMINMELGAGYTQRQVPVKLTPGAEPALMAWAFHYPAMKHGTRYVNHVPSGDFLVFQEERDQARWARIEAIASQFDNEYDEDDYVT